jgi:hypothetical protein
VEFATGTHVGFNHVPVILAEAVKMQVNPDALKDAK